jgi:hypothetical protein
MKLLLLFLEFLFITRSLVLGAFSALKQLRSSLQMVNETNPFTRSDDGPRSKYRWSLNNGTIKKDVVITLSSQDVKVTEE